jgi:penicillin-binding protein 1A
MNNILVRLSLGIFGTIFLAGLLGLGILVYFSMDLPKISTLSDYNPPLSSQILSADGHVLAVLGSEDRQIVQMQEVPQLLIDAFLSAEDAGFYEHSGVDYMGLLRAMIVNVKAGRVVQGGSTITQQVAKSLLLTRERSYSRKIKDFLLALRIEQQFSKEEILFLYLNQVYLGSGYYGIKAAVRGFFDKELDQTTPAEAAMIAGLLVAPGRFSPLINPSRARERQVYVLGRMLSNQKISQEEYDLAISERLQYRLRRPREFQAGYFTEWVRLTVIENIGMEDLLSGGYTIQTTLDWNLQQIAEREVLSGAKDIDKRQGFKGPLRSIAKDEIKDFEQKFRKSYYEENSNYFTINDEFQREYEIPFDEEEVRKLAETREEWQKQYPRLRYRPGFDPEDRLNKLLKTQKFYEAVVTHVDDPTRMIYVSIGGVAGIIPYDYFKWARKREITEQRNYYPYVTRPSSLVKAGDIVTVTIAAALTGIHRHLPNEAKAQLETMPEKDAIISQRYLLCWLDQVPEVQAALLSIDPSNGHILSFVGGVNFRDSQFNRVIQSRRQPGSSFKSLLFAAALENNFTPSTIIHDSPESLGGFDDSLSWKPRNYDGQFKGPMTFRNSLEQSRNIPTIKIAETLGVKTTVDFMKRIEFNAKLDRDLSLALGSFGVSLIDIVSTYGIFPNAGRLVRPKAILSIYDRGGSIIEFSDEEIIEKVDEQTDPEPLDVLVDEAITTLEDENLVEINPFLETLSGDQVYDPRLAYIMTNLLKGAVHHGTGRAALEVSRTLAGKTGTTNNYVDAWFIGFSPNIVSGVWTGFDDNQTMGFGETGARSALPIWKEYMRATIRKFGENDFRVPPGIINVRIDKETGRLASGATARVFDEAFAEGTEPGAVRDQENQSDNNSTQIFGDDDYYENQ